MTAAQETVLIISGEWKFAEAAMATLRHAGFRVLTASGGEESLEIAQREHPQLIISTAPLPAENMKLLQLLGADPRLRAVPVMHVGDSSEKAMDAGSGMEDEKDELRPIPFDPVLLIAEAVRLIERGRIQARARERDEGRERRLRLALEASGIGVWDWDMASGEVDWSNTAQLIPDLATVHGGDRFSAFLGRVHPDDRATVTQAIDRAISSGCDYDVEFRVVWSDGSTHWISSKGRMLPDGSGKPVRMVGASMEITERKRAEDELIARARQQAAVADLGRRALSGALLNQLLDEAATLVARTLDVEYCEVLELLPDRSRLRLRAGVGWKQGLVGHATVGVGTDSQAGYTLLSSEPVIVEDLGTETRFTGPTLLHDHGVTSGMSVIIHGRDRPFGVLGAHTTSRRPFTGDDISFLQSVANVLAITLERKQAEEALRESEKRYRDLVEHSLGLICAHDLDGTLLFVNPAAAHLLGYEPADMAGHNLAEFLAPSVRHLFGAYLKRIRQGVTDSGLMRIMTKSGEERIWSYRNLRYEESGTPPYVLGHAQDVTERRRAEVALKESERRFRELAENIHQVFWIFDPIKGEVIYVSPAYEEIWGRPYPSLYERPYSFMEAVHEEDRPRVRARVERALRGEVRNDEYRIVLPEGAVRWVRDRAFPVKDRAGRVYRIAGIAEDITEQKQAREALEGFSRRLIEVQEAERRRIALELHDQIGQALIGVHMNLRAAKLSADDACLTAQLDDSLRIVDQAIQQVRDLSHELRPALLDDLGLIATLRSYVKEQARRAGVKGEFMADVLAGRLAPEIETACFRIAQEAVTNAMRHAGATRLQVSLSQSGEELHLVIRDDGVGFDPRAAGGRQGHGAGLGLQGMQERALSIGGDLEINSGPGRGTEVRTRIPLTLSSPEESGGDSP